MTSIHRGCLCLPIIGRIQFTPSELPTVHHTQSSCLETTSTSTCSVLDEDLLISFTQTSRPSLYHDDATYADTLPTPRAGRGQRRRRRLGRCRCTIYISWNCSLPSNRTASTQCTNLFIITYPLSKPRLLHRPPKWGRQLCCITGPCDTGIQ